MRRTRNAGQELPGKLLNMRSGERVKLVLLEKVIDTHAEELGDDTDVITMVKRLDQVDAFPASQPAAGELQSRYRGWRAVVPLRTVY